MRDPGELRAIAIHRYSGNWEMDRRGILEVELEEYRRAWDGEAGRQYELKERCRRIIDRR